MGATTVVPPLSLGDQPDSHGELASPSLPLPELQGDTEEYIFLLIECLRATIEGVVSTYIHVHTVHIKHMIDIYISLVKSAQ